MTNEKYNQLKEDSFSLIKYMNTEQNAKERLEEIIGHARKIGEVAEQEGLDNLQRREWHDQ